jgi:hypothetical protein
MLNCITGMDAPSSIPSSVSLQAIAYLLLEHTLSQVELRVLLSDIESAKELGFAAYREVRSQRDFGPDPEKIPSQSSLAVKLLKSGWLPYWWPQYVALRTAIPNSEPIHILSPPLSTQYMPKESHEDEPKI